MFNVCACFCLSGFVCLSGGSRGGWASWFVGAWGPCAKNRTFFGRWWFLALPPLRQGQTCQSSVGFVVFGPGAPCLTGPLGAGPLRVPLGLVVACLLGVVGGGSVWCLVGFVVCFAVCPALLWEAACGGRCGRLSGMLRAPADVPKGSSATFWPLGVAPEWLRSFAAVVRGGKKRRVRTCRPPHCGGPPFAAVTAPPPLRPPGPRLLAATHVPIRTAGCSARLPPVRPCRCATLHLGLSPHAAAL